MSTPTNQIRLVTTPTVGVPHVVLGCVVANGYGDNPGAALQNVTRHLREEAAKLGADAILSVTHSLAYDTRSTWSVTAMGTAVHLAWPDGHASPELHALGS